MIIYIIGDVRSGSTLLDYLLSLSNGSVSVGELARVSNFFFQNDLVAKSWDFKCGCGEPVRECPFWNKVVSSEVKEREELQTKVAIKLPKYQVIIRKLLERSIERVLSRKKSVERGARVASNVWEIYRRILEACPGTSLIIDSSKSAVQAYYLNKFAVNDIKFIVIERNIKAVAYSKMNRVREKASFVEIKAKGTISSIFSSFLVVWRNRIITNLIQNELPNDKVLRITYERLAESPQETMDEICNWANISSVSIDKAFSEAKFFPHQIGGSPGKFSKPTIKVDQRFEEFYRKNYVANYFGNRLAKLLK